MGLNPMPGVLIKDRRETQRRWPRDHRGLIRVAGPQAKECGEELLDAGRGRKDLSLGPSEGPCPTDTLTLGFWTPDGETANFCSLKPFVRPRKRSLFQTLLPGLGGHLFGDERVWEGEKRTPTTGLGSQISPLFLALPSNRAVLSGEITHVDIFLFCFFRLAHG